MTSEKNENGSVNPTPADPDHEPAALDDQEQEQGREEFAAMLEAAGNEPAEPKHGQPVTGTIVQMGDQDAFVDCGYRTELPLAVTELRDADGKPTHQVGDTVSAHVQKVGDGFKLTMAINVREAGRKALADAHTHGTPVRGKVGDTNKGGFSVDLGGVRAFCPFSQIDVRRAEDPSVFVGREFDFKILEYAEDGRNIVVSRRALMQAKRETAAHETRATLQLGDVCEGTVTRLVPFGAFVDIGGIEGLVHISQISHQRLSHPGDVLQEGQPVRVKVLEIQNLGQGRSERISLSMKALASDPWPDTASSLVPGSDTTGKVTRLVDFGVFVELQPGVEGLIHISELANRRIIHPREVVNEDEEVAVRILDVDLDRRRISLSRRQARDYDGD
ncbi:MAG: S1 RNA-binding domain-containing protein [Candidatus Krumholzibacteriia bacterium]